MSKILRQNAEGNSDPSRPERSIRYSTEEILNIEIYGSNQSPIIAVMRNISKSGAFVEIGQSSSRPSKGQFIRGVINLDSIGKSRIFNGEVIWVNEDGFGISFMRKEELVQKIMSKVSA